MEYSERIILLRKAVGLNQAEMAKRLELSPSALSQIESGKTMPSINTLSKLKKEFNVSMDWFVDGKGEMFSLDSLVNNVVMCSDLPSGGACLFPIAAEISAGIPIEVYNGEPLGSVYIDRALIDSPDNIYCFRVNGHSMEPTIKHNDIVFVTSVYDRSHLDNTIFAFRDSDGIMLKLLVLDPPTKTTFLFPLNHEHFPIVYNADSTSNLTIVGKLILSLRRY